jgi:hypothetical protein
MNVKKETRTMLFYFNTTDTPCDNEGDCDRINEDALEAVAIFCILAVLFCCMLCVAGVFKRPTEEITNVAGHTHIEDRKKRKERISKALVVREWPSYSATVESETSGSSSISEVESKCQLPATKNGNRVKCGMGSDERL